ncbi:MAG TPA: PAN domain-containing protein [Burkholderiaceae bacterium]|nr:PAN domain-containing protein [Burkholderiaceae bacterium]
MSTRIAFAKAVAAFCLLFSALCGVAFALESDSNRPGSDYRSLDLPHADPQLCQAQCDREGQCSSWTYVKPGVQGRAARCWLKHSVPQARADNCCVSGLRTGGPVARPGMEAGTNRPGGDYRNFDVSNADPQACQAQCMQEGQCHAWTYVQAGIQGPSGRCWLKSTVPAARPDNCCVSGVVSRAPPEANACQVNCEKRCRERGRPGGTYRGGICLLGVPDENACGCN